MSMKIFWSMSLLFFAASSYGQAQKGDTVVISLAKTSKVVFTIQDRSDLEILRHYNFQDLFHDILTRIENSDTATYDSSMAAANENDTTNSDESEARARPEPENDDEEDEDWNSKVERRRTIGRTWQSTNVDIGTNNYIEDGQFPTGSKAYNVRPWGSWYVAITSTQRTRVGRNFFFEWGAGVSWYNFKFEQDNIIPQRSDNEVLFTSDTRGVNHLKSKLSATFVNVSFVPLLDFGDHSRKPRFWDGYGSEFRMGVGPYVGYRIGSKSKLVYKDTDGDREIEKNRDSFYLNNLRYGARLQVGFRSTDFFLNYDLNELFASGKQPKLNAVSFGVIF